MLMSYSEQIAMLKGTVKQQAEQIHDLQIMMSEQELISEIQDNKAIEQAEQIELAAGMLEVAREENQRLKEELALAKIMHTCPSCGVPFKAAPPQKGE